MAALEIRGLKKSFGAFTLGPLDLTVPDGAIYGFVGPNGAGKTLTRSSWLYRTRSSILPASAR
jgi:ABC-2 type transport system ATP-binding protein